MVTVEWNWTAAPWPIGIRVVRDPRCKTELGGLRGHNPCGKLATVRVTRGTSWSLMWCPEHARSFLEGD